MIEVFDKASFEPSGERCAIGGHKILKNSPYRPEISISGSIVCEAHYHAINVHGIGVVRERRAPDAMIWEVNRRHKALNAQKAKAAAVREARGKQPGFVYYIRMDDLIKIGYSTDVERRMRAYPPSAELLAVHPGTPQLEREMHLDHKAFLRRGREWFEPHESLVSHIEKVRAQFGDPAQFAYQYSQPK